MIAIILYCKELFWKITTKQKQTFNKLFLSCIERHAPLKRIKITRPQAPWMKDLVIGDL